MENNYKDKRLIYLKDKRLIKMCFLPTREEIKAQIEYWKNTETNKCLLRFGLMQTSGNIKAIYWYKSENDISEEAAKEFYYKKIIKGFSNLPKDEKGDLKMKCKPFKPPLYIDFNAYSQELLKNNRNYLTSENAETLSPTISESKISKIIDI